MKIGGADALILVDIQRDFCPGGALAVPDGDDVIPPSNRLMERCRFGAVVATQDWHPPGHSSFASTYPGKQPFEQIELDYGSQTLWPDHCVQGSAGADFHPGLVLDPVDLIIRKGFRKPVDSYSAFQENDRKTLTGLAGYLKERGIARTFLAGLAADVCVFFSAMDARAAGFETVFLEDAARGIDRDGSRERTRADVHAAGVILARTEEIESA